MFGYEAIAAEAQVVEISDPRLREAIEEALGKSPGTLITANDMLTVRSIDRWSWGPSDIDEGTLPFQHDIANLKGLLEAMLPIKLHCSQTIPIPLTQRRGYRIICRTMLM